MIYFKGTFYRTERRTANLFPVLTARSHSMKFSEWLLFLKYISNILYNRINNLIGNICESIIESIFEIWLPYLLIPTLDEW